MIGVASQFGSGEPIRIRKIAERHGVPPRFLVQILLQLKGAGLVASTRGAAGGYHLVRPPDQVSLGEVMEVVEGSSDENGRRPAPHRIPGGQSPVAGLEAGRGRGARIAPEHYLFGIARTRQEQDEQMYLHLM